MHVPIIVLALHLALPSAARASVVGGQETRTTWPFMALVEVGQPDDGEQPFCGGSLVARRWVLTAAHCVPRDGDLSVVLGRRQRSGSRGERIAARSVLVSPRWDGAGDDVALIELDRRPARPRPVRLAAAGEEEAWASGDIATVLGWGATSEGGQAADVLREAQVPIVSDADCERSLTERGWAFAAGVMLCAGYPEGGTDTCEGDSGGPLLVRLDSGALRLVGVTSFGDGCGREGRPGVYAEAAGPEIRGWIHSIVPAAVSGGAGSGPASGAGVRLDGAAPAPSRRWRRSRAARRAACRRRARRIDSPHTRTRALRRCARLR